MRGIRFSTKVLTFVALVVVFAISISSLLIKLSRPIIDIDQYSNQLRRGDDSSIEEEDINDERGDQSGDVNIIMPATLEDDVEVETNNDFNLNDNGETTTSRRLLPKMISFEYNIDKKPEKTRYYSRAVRWATIKYINLKVLPLKISYATDDFEENSMPSNPPIITKDWYSPNAQEYQMDGYDSSACEPMYDWQLKSYPNCNNVHELNLQQMKLINSGGSRIAFEMKQQLNGTRHESKFVYKTKKEVNVSKADVTL